MDVSETGTNGNQIHFHSGLVPMVFSMPCISLVDLQYSWGDKNLEISCVTWLLKKKKRKSCSKTVFLFGLLLGNQETATSIQTKRVQNQKDWFSVK